MAKKRTPGSFVKGDPRCGRPSSYTKEIGDEICNRIAEGESLRSICRDEHMPHRRTVINWALTDGHTFFAQYAKARDIQADAMVDEITDITDDASNDWMERESKKGNIEIICNNEAVNRSRLRFEARKWIAGKIRPKKYGEKYFSEISGGLKLLDLVLPTPEKP